MSITDSSRFHRLAKEGAWILSGQFASVIGALVLVRVLTEYLEPAQYGQLALGLTVAGLVNQVVMGGVTAGIGRYYSIAAEKNDLSGYLHASQRLMGYATVVVVAIALVLMTGLLWLGYSQWMGLAAAALVLSVLSGYNASLSGIQNAARQRAVVAFHGGLDAWLKILLAVGVMLWLGRSSTAVVLGYVLSSLVVTGSQLFFLRRLIRPPIENPRICANWGRQIWAYSWPFSVFGIFTWAQQVSDRWALQIYTSSTDVGHYALLFQLGYTPIVLATGMALSFIGPILYQRAGDATNLARNEHAHQLGLRITQFSLVMTLLGFVITLTTHELIFRILVAAEYRRISYLLPWVVLAGGLFSAGQILATKFLSENKTTELIAVKIIASLLGVALNFSGAYFYGLNGIVAAIVIFSCIHFAWISILIRRPIYKE